MDTIKALNYTYRPTIAWLYVPIEQMRPPGLRAAFIFSKYGFSNRLLAGPVKIHSHMYSSYCTHVTAFQRVWYQFT